VGKRIVDGFVTIAELQHRDKNKERKSYLLGQSS
jgi:hypothetical protein